MAFLDKHKALERSPTLLFVGSLLVVSIGGIVEIAPLFYLENTIEEVEGMRPYSPLELAGRDVYIREGVLCMPLADDPSYARRGGTVWALQPCRRVDV